MTPKHRNAALAKIHLGAKSIGLAKDAYRAMIREIGGAESGSAADLDRAGIDRVVDHLAGLGAEFTRPARAGKKPRMTAGLQAMVDKIDAYLAEAGKPMAYADGIAKRRVKVEKIAWCNAAQLGVVIGELEKAARKAGRPTR
jgi:phage gp16-like protein